MGEFEKQITDIFDNPFFLKDVFKILAEAKKEVPTYEKVYIKVTKSFKDTGTLYPHILSMAINAQLILEQQKWFVKWFGE